MITIFVTVMHHVMPHDVLLQARLYEVVYEVYQIIIPVYAAKRQFRELEKVHVKLSECFQNIVAKVRIQHLINCVFTKELLL